MDAKEIEDKLNKILCKELSDSINKDILKTVKEMVDNEKLLKERSKKIKKILDEE